MSPTLHRVTASEVVVELPSPRPLPGSARLPSGVLYVTALGFEPRGLAALERFHEPHEDATGDCIILTHRTNRAENERSRPALEDLIRRQRLRRRETSDDAKSLRSTLEDLLSERQSQGGTVPVMLDISAMSSRQILVVLSALLELNGVELTVLYAEAELYAPSREEFERDRAVWAKGGGVDLGVLDVAVLDSHPGYRVDHLPDVLCLIAGFSQDRALAVISTVFPGLVPRRQGVIRWFIGEPQRSDFSWRLTAAAELHGLDPSSSNVRSLSTFDYRQTFEALDSTFREFAMTHLVSVAPLGSKMQTVGAVLYASVRPEIRLLTARPERYAAASYSSGVREVWALELDDVAVLRRRLARLDVLELR